MQNEANERRLRQLDEENARRRNAVSRYARKASSSRLSLLQTTSLQQMGTQILQGQMDVQEQVLQYQFVISTPSRPRPSVTKRRFLIPDVRAVHGNARPSELRDQRASRRTSALSRQNAPFRVSHGCIQTQQRYVDRRTRDECLPFIVSEGNQLARSMSGDGHHMINCGDPL